MTYGSATTSDDVVVFLNHVYGSKTPSPSIVTEFERRFDLIGSSPLIEITMAQANGLEAELNKSFGDGSYKVVAGMLHSAPTIDNAVAQLVEAGCKKMFGLLLSPQYSEIIMGGYHRSLEAAAAKYGISFSIINPWPDEPNFIKLTASRLMEEHQKLSKQYGQAVPIILTTHSLPESVVNKDPGYLGQLQQTVAAIVREAGLKDNAWESAYQSAGHTPEKWLTPDLKDILASYANQAVAGVLIVPIQFLADHLEVLYDLDIAAREQANELGIHYHRIQLPNLDNLFIKALANIVQSKRYHK